MGTILLRDLPPDEVLTLAGMMNTSLSERMNRMRLETLEELHKTPNPKAKECRTCGAPRRDFNGKCRYCGGVF